MNEQIGTVITTETIPPTDMEVKSNFINRRMVAAVAAGLALSACGSGNTSPEPTPTATEFAEPTPTATESSPAVCVETWAVKQTNNEQHRIVFEGLESIGVAENEEEAREALDEGIDIIVQDPEALAGVANIINSLAGRETNYVSSEMSDGECMTVLGEQAATEIRTWLAVSTVEPSEAPADGYNTGVDDKGEMVYSGTPGISGNRKAVKVTLPNGEEVWLMERCLNIVIEQPPRLPEGPTDEVVVPNVGKTDDDRLVEDPTDGAGQSSGAGDEVGAGQGEANQGHTNDGRIEGEVVAESTEGPDDEPTEPEPTSSPTGPSGTEGNPAETPDDEQETAPPSDAPTEDDEPQNNGPDEPSQSESPSDPPPPADFKYNQYGVLESVTVRQ